MSYVLETITNLLGQTAFASLTPGNYVMIGVACVFLFLAIKKGFEPLLLVPIAFGMLLVNIYPDIIRRIPATAWEVCSTISTSWTSGPSYRLSSLWASGQ